MRAKIHIIFLGLPIASTVACGGSNNSGTADLGAVDARSPDVSSAVDMNVIPDLPFAEVPDAVVCDQLAAAARAQFESYLQSASSLVCQVDSDCSDLSPRSWNCFAACGQVVRTADITTLTVATASACDAYFGVGCPAITPPCIFPHAFCDHGTCATGFGPGGLSGSVDAAIDTATVEVPSDGVGGNKNYDVGLDSLVGVGDPVDGGSQGEGMAQCNFPGVSQALTCAGGEYCMAFGGGIPIDSGISYTCAAFPEACVADHSCACVCSTASSNPASYCAVRGQQCLCSVTQGILTLLCASP
jgi:hypothetical protein